MTTIVYLLLQVPDTSIVAVLTDPPVTHVSLFSDSVAMELIQVFGIVVVAIISSIATYQVAKLKTNVNHKMDELLKTTRQLGEAAGKAKEQEDQKLRDQK